MKKFLALLSLAMLMAPTAHAFNDSTFGMKDRYYKVLKKFTKKNSILALGYFNTKVIWYATYKSEEFRQAFELHFNKLYPEGQDALAYQLARPWMQASGQAEFFLSLYAHEPDLEELGNEDSLWDLSLQVGTQVYKPVSVEPVDLTSFTATFFPYINGWSVAYRIVFSADPAQLAENPFILQLASVAGTTRLKFNKK